MQFETIKNYLILFLLIISLIQGYCLYANYQESKEFQVKYGKLVLTSEGLQKEIDRLRKEADNVVVPDLKEDQVVDYWKEYLK